MSPLRICLALTCLALASPWSLGGCSEVTELVVAIDSDLHVPAELDAVGLEVSYPDTSEQVVFKTWEVDLNQKYAVKLPATIGLIPGKDPGRPILITISGYKSVANKDVKQLDRRAKLSFAPDRVLLLRMNLLRSCLYTICPAGETCGEKGCEPIGRDANELPDFVPGKPLPGITDGRTDIAVDAGPPDSAPDAPALDDTAADAPADAPAPDAPVTDASDASSTDAATMDATPPSWKVFPKPSDTFLWDVWGSASNDLWCTGSGTLFHYQGSSWKQVTKPTTNSIFGLWGSGASDIWGVGHNGTIIHYNGVSWSTSTSPLGAGVIISDVWGAGATSVWAVASTGAILSNTGSGWTVAATPVSTELHGIWGASSTAIWAVGAGGKVVFYDGTSWKVQPSPTTDALYSVWGSSAAEVWAVSKTQVHRRFQGSWSSSTPIPTAKLYSIWAGSPGEAWVVGGPGGLWRFTPTGKTQITPLTSGNLYSVWGRAPNAIWAVGGSVIQSVVLHYGN